MVQTQETSRAVAPPRTADVSELGLLRSRYEAYCAQQAAALPALLPREWVRALYRDARATVARTVTDPLALLVQHCRNVLPLPPFEVWMEDYRRDRRPYLEALGVEASGPRRDAPVTVELRPFEHAGESWCAGLALFHEPPGWQGFIRFHREGAVDGAQRTADVFLADTPEAVRVRFRSFSPNTLQAFLRSTLP